jgi:hypothetical protein
MNDQQANALRVGNTIRSKKKEVKRQIRAVEVDVVDVILTTTLPFTVAEIVKAIPGFGDVKLRKICKATGIEPHKRLCTSRPTQQLTDRQKTELASIIADILECRESPTKGYSPYGAVAA